MTIQVFKKRIILSVVCTVLIMFFFGIVLAPPLFAADETAVAATGQDAPNDLMWVVLSAAIAFSFGAIAAGFAISRVGAAAMGAMSEKPEIGSQALIFIALAEGLVVFGFITALMILGKV